MTAHKESKGMWKKILTIVLGAVFVLGLVAFSVGLVLTRDLLSPELYTQALSENNIYERVYTDLLADPAIQESFKETTGIQIDLIGEELYAQVVGLLYRILPPQRMEAAANAFFTNLTAYLKGDVPELQEDVNFGSAATPEVLADRIVKAAAAIVAEAIDKRLPFVAKKTKVLVEDELVTYLDNFNEGRLIPIPKDLLSASVSSLTTADLERLVTVMLGPASRTARPQTRLQMKAALAEDDLPSAVALATTARLERVVGERMAGAKEQLAASQTLVGISGAALAIGETRDSVVAGLNTARDYVRVLETALIPLASLLVILLAIILWLNSEDLRSALRAAGWTLTIASGLVLLLWLGGGIFLRSRISAGLATAQLGPASLDAMVGDLLAALIRGIWGSLWATTLTFLILGLVLLAFGYIKRLLASLENLFSGLWQQRRWVLGAFVLIFVLLPLLFGIFREDARAANEPCNGHPELCERLINEVAYAASHNAMSIAEYGWIWPMQDGTLTEQLDAGVRALLIDTHYLDDEQASAEYLDSLTEETRAVVEEASRIFGKPEQGAAYLCHQFCGMGWTPLLESFEEIRIWLQENPREVLFIIIQDEISAADTESYVELAGLKPFIYSHTEGDPWPTLRELIDRGERLLIMAENEGPPPAWYTHVWDVTEETPYTFIMPDQFNCEPNRGGTSKPFFLLNHWIQRGSPNRLDAAVVNEYDFLLSRAQQCGEERGKIPNFVAVNWYSQGDLFDVVDTLNGIDR